MVVRFGANDIIVFMRLTLDEVKRIAHLARLKLTKQEEKKYQEQLSSILDHVAKLQDLDTSKIEAKHGLGELRSRLRADEPGISLTGEELLNNAPDTKKNQFKVPPVLDDKDASV